MNPLRLRLPATSANLGPGFDAVGLALGIYLKIAAQESVDGEFRIRATGRDAAKVGSVEGNLVLRTYRSLAAGGPALELEVENEIPLGMGCGSSAAALLAGVLLADHFGGLGLTRRRVLEEACRREGHPDNVAACWLGGFTVAAMEDGLVTAVSVAGPEVGWRVFLALPAEALATETARGLLPDSYRRGDAVANLQATGLLVSAFALGRGDLLQAGMRDRLHQPYREQACPLLGKLLPLAGVRGVLGVALSGAGPAVLVVASEEADAEEVKGRMLRAAGDLEAEVLEAAISGGVESA